MLRQVGLQIVNACNTGCIFCDKRLCQIEPLTYMSLPQIDSLVDQIAGMGITTTTGICGIAEAVFHPQFEDAVKLVNRIPWSFGSNCLAMTPEKSDVILKYQPDLVNLSIDAVTPEVHASMRPNLQYEKVVSNARYFLEALGRAPVWERQIYIQMVVTKLNGHQVQEFIDYWLPLIEGMPGVHLHIKPCFAWPRIPKEELDTFFPSPYVPTTLFQHPQVMIDEFVSTVKVRDTCRLFWHFAWVKADGSYMPCCMCGDDLWKVGNVFESSIFECYNSPRMDELRRLFDAKQYDDVPLCSICTV